MSKLVKLLHRVTHMILCACSATCPECGDPCVNTFNHQDGEHSCGDHSW